MRTTDNTQEDFLFITELSSKERSKLRGEFLREKWSIIEPGLNLACLAGLGGLIALLPTFMQYFNAVIGVLVVFLSCIVWVYVFFEYENWLREFLWKKYLRKRLKE